MTTVITKISNHVDYYFKDHKKYIFEGRLYIKYNNITCLIIIVEDNKLIIGGLKKGLLSGTRLLKNILDLIYQNIDEIDLIYLGDESTITLTVNTINKEKYILSLAHLHILVKGKSWYNSCGFFQENYLEQFEEWNIIRNMKLIDCLNSIKKDNYVENGNFQAAHSRFTYFVKFDENGSLLRSYYLLIESIFDVNLTVSDICTLIYNDIKSNIITDFKIFDIYILILNLCSSKINYNEKLYNKKI